MTMQKWIHITQLGLIVAYRQPSFVKVYFFWFMIEETVAQSIGLRVPWLMIVRRRALSDSWFQTDFSTGAMVYGLV